MSFVSRRCTTLNAFLHKPTLHKQVALRLFSSQTSRQRPRGTNNQLILSSKIQQRNMSSTNKKDNKIFTRDNLFDLKGKVALVTGRLLVVNSMKMSVMPIGLTN
jgi:hypothetical protein